MRPQSFDDFIKKDQAGVPEGSEESSEEFKLEKCPTPGCSCGQLHLDWDQGVVSGFKCAFGCAYSAKRNAFTNDLMYYALEDFDRTRFANTADLKGLKINAMGEVYTDWY